jgi:hypothetical protein
MLHFFGDLLAGFREVDELPEEPGIFHTFRERSEFFGLFPQIV